MVFQYFIRAELHCPGEIGIHFFFKPLNAAAINCELCNCSAFINGIAVGFKEVFYALFNNLNGGKTGSLLNTRFLKEFLDGSSKGIIKNRVRYLGKL